MNEHVIAYYYSKYWRVPNETQDVLNHIIDRECLSGDYEAYDQERLRLQSEMAENGAIMWKTVQRYNNTLLRD